MAVSEGALKQSSVKWSAKAQPSGSSAHKESTSSPRKHANAVGFNGLNEESAGTWQPGSGRSRPSAWRRLVPAIVFGYSFNRQLWRTPETTTETPTRTVKKKKKHADSHVTPGMFWCLNLCFARLQKKNKSIFRFQNKVVSIKQTRTKNIFLLRVFDVRRCHGCKT